MQIHDQVFVMRTGSRHTFYHSGRIVKVTPSGTVYILIGSSTEPLRFKNGKQIGGDFSRYYLDTIPYAEREALLAQEVRTGIAAAAINSVKLSESAKSTWGKEYLAKQIVQLEALLEEARKAVEMI